MMIIIIITITITIISIIVITTILVNIIRALEGSVLDLPRRFFAPARLRRRL